MIVSLVASFLVIAFSYIRGWSLLRPSHLPTATRKLIFVCARADDCNVVDAHPDSSARSSLRSFRLPPSWSSLVVVSAIVITPMIGARSGLVLASVRRTIASAMARPSAELRSVYDCLADIVIATARLFKIMLATDPEPSPAQIPGPDRDPAIGIRRSGSGSDPRPVSSRLPRSADRPSRSRAVVGACFATGYS